MHVLHVAGAVLSASILLLRCLPVSALSAGTGSNATNGTDNSTTVTATSTFTTTTGTITTMGAFTTTTFSSVTATVTTATATSSSISTTVTTISTTSTSTTPPGAVITGAIKMSIEGGIPGVSGADFFEDPNVPLALPAGVANLAQVPLSLGYSEVVSWKRGRRLRAGDGEGLAQEGRWLAEETDAVILELQYRYKIPGDAPSPISKDFVLGALAYGTSFDLENRFQKAISQRTGQGMYVTTLVEHEGPRLDGVQVTTTQAPPPNATAALTASNTVPVRRGLYCLWALACSVFFGMLQ